MSHLIKSDILLVLLFQVVQKQTLVEVEN